MKSRNFVKGGSRYVLKDNYGEKKVLVAPGRRQDNRRGKVIRGEIDSQGCATRVLYVRYVIFNGPYLGKD